MNREVEFAQKLQELKDNARLQGGYLTKEQIEEAFDYMTAEQLEMVYDYFEKQKVGIGEPIIAEESLSGEDKGYLDYYLQELGELQEIAEGEKRAITMSAMAGDKEAREQMILMYLPQVVEVAKLYTGQGVLLEDLIGEGNAAVVAGVSMIDCLEEPEEAEGMLGKRMMDAMEELVQENSTEGQLNEVIVARVNKIMEAAKDMAEELQREVTKEEVARELHMAIEEIEEAIRISGHGIEYITKKDKEA